MSGYQPRPPIRYEEMRIKERYKSKYEDKVFIVLFLLFLFGLNFAVWYFNGFVVELIFSILIGCFGGFLFAAVFSTVIEWCYFKVKQKALHKREKKQIENDQFEQFIKGCRK